MLWTLTPDGPGSSVKMLQSSSTDSPFYLKTSTNRKKVEEINAMTKQKQNSVLTPDREKCQRSMKSTGDFAIEIDFKWKVPWYYNDG